MCWTNKCKFTRTQAAVVAMFASWPASAAVSRQRSLSTQRSQRSLSTARLQTSVATVSGKCEQLSSQSSSLRVCLPTG